MKKLLTTICLVLLAGVAVQAQQTQQLPAFDKIIISPKISIELRQGEEENITWEVFGVDEDKVNIEVKRHKLHIYLDDARLTIKPVKGKYGWSYPMYDEQVLVKATITYRTLEKLEIRGEEKVDVANDIQGEDKFVLKLYGASEVRLTGLQTDKFKAVLIGENDLKINSGLTPKQKIKSIGENIVDFSRLQAYDVKASTIGENVISLNVKDYVHVSGIGESQIQVKGNPHLSKGLVIGENHISRD